MFGCLNVRAGVRQPRLFSCLLGFHERLEPEASSKVLRVKPSGFPQPRSPLGLRLLGRLPLWLGLGRLLPRYLPGDLLSNLLGDQLGNYLRRFSDPLLGGLAQYEKEHEGDQHDYDQYQRAYQCDYSPAHVVLASSSSLARRTNGSYPLGDAANPLVPG